MVIFIANDNPALHYQLHENDEKNSPKMVNRVPASACAAPDRGDGGVTAHRSMLQGRSSPSGSVDLPSRLFAIIRSV